METGYKILRPHRREVKLCRAGDSRLSTPMRRTRSACCARRGERPCCAAETRDELPPSHFRPPRDSAEPIALGAAWEPDRRVCGCAVWSVPGPTLPSAASAGHGSYLGISCRQLRSGITAEVDPDRTFAQMPSCKGQGHNLLALALYSITSWARTNTEGGTARPSALAVLRFTIIS